MTPESFFLGWHVPLIPQSARALLDHYTISDEADLRGVVVVLPGSRARNRLLECLATEAADRGVTLIPPRAATVGQIVEILYPPERRRASREAQVRGWARALLETGTEDLKPAFPHLTADTLRERRDSLANLLVDVRTDLAQEGHDFSDVARITGTWDGFQDGARWETLARVQARAVALIEGAGFEDPWEARRRLLASPPAPPAQKVEVWLVGLAELSGVTRAVLEASGATLRTLVHSPPPASVVREPTPEVETQAPFDPWGLPRASFWARYQIPLEEHQIHVANRPADQARRVVQILQDLEPAPRVDEVLLAVSQGSDVLPHIDHELLQAGVRTRFGGGTPLHETEVFRLLQTLAAWLDTARWEHLAAFLRHPACPALLQAAGVRKDGGSAPELADLWFNHHLPHRLAGTLPSEDPTSDTRGGKNRAPFTAMVQALLREGPVAALKGIDAPLSTWMPRIMDLLLAAYGSKSFQEHARGDRLLLLALDALRDRAEVLAELSGSLDEVVSGAEALRILLDAVSRHAIPFEADPEAVELLDWLEVVVDDASVVLITGFNEGGIPPSQVGDPLLPDRLRSHLGLPDNTRRMGRDAYRLTALLHSCPAVHVITGQQSGAGDPLRPSRLLFQTDPETAARRVQFVMHPKTEPPDTGLSAGAEGPHEGPHEAPPVLKQPFVVPPEPILTAPPAGLPDSLTVTQFRTLLADPYRFALTVLHKLTPISDEAREMDGLLFGLLAHDVLEAFGRQAIQNPTWGLLRDAEALGAHLVQDLRQRARRQFGANPLPAVHLQCLQLEGRLRAFATAQVQWADAGWQIRSVEGEFRDEKHPFPVDGEPFFIRGRIDRIDYHPDTGEWAILDYKTSAKATTPEKAHRVKKNWVDLQLPLYRHLALSILGPDGDDLLPRDAVARGSVRVGYVALPQDPSETAFLLADWDASDLAEADACAEQAIRTLRSGSFAFDPERTAQSGFADDPLKPLLSAGWIPEEDEATDKDDVS